MSVGLPLESMTIAEKLTLLEAVWDSVCRSPTEFDSPAWHQEVLAERQRRLESGEAAVSDWESAKRRLQDLGQ